MSEDKKLTGDVAKVAKGNTSKDSTNKASSDKPAAKSETSGKNGTSPLFKHFIAYAIAIVIIGGLGYLYYTTYLINQLAITANSELSLENNRQLGELQGKYSDIEGELTLKLRELQDIVTTDKQKIEQLEEVILGLQQQVPLIQEQIKPRELWQIQLSQLLSLAEQERVLASRPTNVNYLLLQVQELLVSIPSGEVAPELKRLVNQDIDTYEELTKINLGSIYQEINIVEEIITDDLEFKTSFYDQITDAAENNYQTEYKLPGFIKTFANSISNYIRISRDAEPDQILTQDKRDLTLSAIVLTLHQAQLALIQRDKDLFYAVLEDAKEDVLKFFIDGLEKDRVVDLIDQLLNADILPSDLPAIRSYEFLSRSNR